MRRPNLVKEFWAISQIRPPSQKFQSNWSTIKVENNFKFWNLNSKFSQNKNNSAYTTPTQPAQNAHPNVLHRPAHKIVQKNARHYVFQCILLTFFQNAFDFWVSKFVFFCFFKRNLFFVDSTPLTPPAMLVRFPDRPREQSLPNAVALQGGVRGVGSTKNK